MTTAQLDHIRIRAGELMERNGWSREKLLAHQASRLQDLLRHAVEHSPYYRDAFGAGPWRLADLPTLPKATLMENFDRIVTDPEVTLAGVEEHLRGEQAGEPLLGRYRVLATSGTTGLRGYVLMSDDEFETWMALHMRVFAAIGIGPGTRVAAIGAPSPLHWSRRLFEALRSGREDAPSLTVATPAAETLGALNAYQPQALLGYPSIHATLADWQLEGRLRIRPEFVVAGGEAVTEDVASRIRAAWGIEPIVVYPTTEAPLIAAASAQGRELEIVEDLLVVEVVDEDDRPVPAGTPGAKVLMTSLVSRALPLIRYAISDAVTLAAGPNPAGRPYARIERVDGRLADTLVLPGRAGGTVAVHPIKLGPAFAGVPEVRRFQVIHDETGIEVRAVVSAEDALERVRERLVAVLEEAGAVPPTVRAVAVDELEREPGPAAKFRIVKSAFAAQG